MKLYEFSQGRTPLFISTPHDGTRIPGDLEARMTKRALQRPDTDWHVARLYQFAQDLGASLIRPLYHRYVVDLNRAPDDTTLYPGSSNTEVCPSSCFDDSPIYRDGAVPDATEVAERIDTYWRPYHQCLQQELARIRNAHGVALLYEAHTIRSRAPRFFEGGTARLQPGHRRWQELCVGADTTSCRPVGTDRGVYLHRQRALQRRLYHTRLWQARRRYPCRATGAIAAHIHGRGPSLYLS